jgi:outer membrane receptor protein involved in Fe transport
MSERRKLPRGAAAGSAGAVALLISTVAGAADNSVIAEVVVTAQKRVENVQDVPTSVSVFGDEKIAQLHANQLSDYAAYIPGLNVSGVGTPGQATITLRGIAPVGPGAVVGTYVDDTPLGSSANYARATEFGLDLMPYDVERVEVLRGPQGTLYGAGTMGGLLKYVLKDPDPGAFEFRAGVEGSSIDGGGDVGWGARAGLNVPLGEKVALRASFYNQETPGYIDNVTTGEEDENDYKQYGGRASLLWQITDTLSLKLGGMWQRLETDDNGSVALDVTSLGPNGVTLDPIGDLKSRHGVGQPFNKDVDYYSATLNWNLGWGSFISATSYSQTDTVQIQDATEVFGVFFGADESPFRLGLGLDKWTQEFRLASNSEGRVEWLVGAFYTEEDSTNTQDVFAYANGQPVFADPVFIFAKLPTTYKEVAGFGDLTFKFTDSFDVTAGLRWAKNKQDFRQISGGALPGLPTTETPNQHSEEDVWTYAISPRWHISDDTMAYLRVASGYRPGGPNVVILAVPVPPTVDADKLTNYEVGLKTEFLDRRALLNLSAFYIDWTDIQQVQGFGGVSGLTNAGDATTQGAELESRFLIGDSFQLGFNVAYTDATLDDGPSTNQNPLDPDLAWNVAGEQLPLVPEWSGSITADYNFTFPGGHPAHVGAGWRYVDERRTAVLQTSTPPVEDQSYVMPSYDALDLNADVSFERLTVRLFVKNVTDERGYTGGGIIVNLLDQPVQEELGVLQPRTYGISLDFTF